MTAHAVVNATGCFKVLNARRSILATSYVLRVLDATIPPDARELRRLTVEALQELDLTYLSAESWGEVELDTLELISYTFDKLTVMVARDCSANSRSPSAGALAEKLTGTKVKNGAAL